MATANGDTSIHPFEIHVEESILENLKKKLELRRLPGQTPDHFDLEEDRLCKAENGVPVKETEDLAKYWLEKFDWRAQEQRINGEIKQFKTNVTVEGESGLDLHFLWEKSQNENAVPLLMVHGWPSSPFEFSKIIKDLANPKDTTLPRFHIVAPSLPGHAFSDTPKGTEFGIQDTAAAFNVLMKRLGYEKYFVYGCDWGSFVCRALAINHPENVRGTHQNMVLTKTPSAAFQKIKFVKLALSFISGGGVLPWTYSKREVDNLKHVQKVVLRNEMGYNQMMSTKPLTISYGLMDSPVGLLAWIWEKLKAWSDDYAWSKDEILTWVMIYWVAGIYGSANLYKAYQKERETLTGRYSKVPLGVSLFEGDLYQLPDDFASMVQPVVFFKRHAKGGHFPGFEQPDALMSDIRECVTRVLGTSGS